MYIRRDVVKPPLTPLYNGAFPVMARSAKALTVDIARRSDVISLDCLKPAFIFVLLANNSLTPNPYDLSEPPSPITRKKSVFWDPRVSDNKRSSYHRGGGSSLAAGR